MTQFSVPSFPTVVDAVEVSAESGGLDLVFHLQAGPVRLSPGELLEGARERAAFLISRDVAPGDPVGVLGPNAPEWVLWAMGAWLARAALVPVPYPIRVRDRDSFAFQVGAATRAVGCRLIVAHPKFDSMLPDEDMVVDWSTRPPVSSSLDGRRPEPDDIAVIQLTSGSTALPKGAQLTHRAVEAGVRAIRTQGQMTPERDRGVAWLPFFHDNGLFGHIILPLAYAGESHLLPVERFARNPLTWFRLLTEVGGTVTSGPSSAWSMALRTAARRPDGIDLSSLRWGMMSAESIDPTVVDRLSAEGPALGLDPAAMAGAYGMAEATLGLTICPPGRGIRTDQVDLDRLASEGTAVPATGARTKRVASCGFPIPGVQIRIVGPEGHLPERTVGEIVASAPSVMEGYTGADAPQPIEDGWLRTGDLGYVADGELFVTGRVKELIISFGRNYHPEDIEWAVARLPEIREGRTVAFAPTAEDGRAVVVFEPDPRQDDLDGLPARAREAVTNATGLAAPTIVVVPRGTIPRTTSGKLQRVALREAWLRGDLARVALAMEPKPMPAQAPGDERQ
jgi:acyl-CoA synthetase (AMP-forming)/AMP-acid ligase II